MQELASINPQQRMFMMFIPSRKNLGDEQDLLAEELSRNPCKECRKMKLDDCLHYGENCWKGYRKQAVSIQRKFLIPLHALCSLRFATCLVAALCCVYLLAFPAMQKNHHILETSATLAIDKLKSAWPTLQEIIHNTVSQHELEQRALATNKPSH